jgi:hypothetical protein
MMKITYTFGDSTTEVDGDIGSFQSPVANMIKLINDQERRIYKLEEAVSKLKNLASPELHPDDFGLVEACDVLEVCNRVLWGDD